MDEGGFSWDKGEFFPREGQREVDFCGDGRGRGNHPARIIQLGRLGEFDVHSCGSQREGQTLDNETSQMP